MAVTRTIAPTTTHTRIDLLVDQVEVALIRTVDISEDLFTRVFSRGIRRRYIRRVFILGKNNRGEVCASLSLSFNWEQHILHLDAGCDTVAVSRRWKDGVAPGLSELVTQFLEYGREEGLEIDWRVQLTNEKPEAEIMSYLGLVDAAPTVWAGRTIGYGWTADELDELHIGMRVVAPEASSDDPDDFDDYTDPSWCSYDL